MRRLSVSVESQEICCFTFLASRKYTKLVYMCRNMAMNFRVFACLAVLSVAVSSPDISYPSDTDIYKAYDSQMSLVCNEESSNTQAAIHWQLNGKDITHDNDKYIIKAEDQSSTLTVNRLAAADAGEYKCLPGGSTRKLYVVDPHVNVSVVLPSRPSARYPGGNDLVNKENDNATLVCLPDIASEDGATFIWYYAGTQTDSDKRDRVRDAVNNTLYFDKVVYASHLGNYICNGTLANGTSFEKSLELQGKPEAKFETEKKNLVEGDPLSLKCEARGFPIPTVMWFRADVALNESDPRLELKDITNDDGDILAYKAALRLTQMEASDEGKYKCVALSENTMDGTFNATAEIAVNVKDKLAALWPFLGICAEVAILCTIIFIYERQRSKKEQEKQNEEIKEEAVPMNANNKENDEDLRQRNNKA